MRNGKKLIAILTVFSMLSVNLATVVRASDLGESKAELGLDKTPTESGLIDKNDENNKDEILDGKKTEDKIGENLDALEKEKADESLDLKKGEKEISDEETGENKKIEEEQIEEDENLDKLEEAEVLNNLLDEGQSITVANRNELIAGVEAAKNKTVKEIIIDGKIDIISTIDLSDIDNLVIKGKNQPVLDANNMVTNRKDEIKASNTNNSFKIGENSKITLENLKISGEFSDRARGGAIENFGSLKLDGVYFYKTRSDVLVSGDLLGNSIYNHDGGNINITGDNIFYAVGYDGNNDSKIGSIYNEGNIVIGEGETVTSMKHYGDQLTRGSVLYNTELGDIEFKNISFTISDFGNNAIYNEGVLKSTKGVSIDLVKGNPQTDNGGKFIYNTGSMSLTNLTIQDGHEDFIYNSGDLDLVGLNISNSTGNKHSGAYINLDGGKLSINSGRVDNFGNDNKEKTLVKVSKDMSDDSEVNIKRILYLTDNFNLNSYLVLIENPDQTGNKRAIKIEESGILAKTYIKSELNEGENLDIKFLRNSNLNVKEGITDSRISHDYNNVKIIDGRFTNIEAENNIFSDMVRFNTETGNTSLVHNTIWGGLYVTGNNIRLENNLIAMADKTNDNDLDLGLAKKTLSNGKLSSGNIIYEREIDGKVYRNMSLDSSNSDKDNIFEGPVLKRDKYDDGVLGYSNSYLIKYKKMKDDSYASGKVEKIIDYDILGKPRTSMSTYGAVETKTSKLEIPVKKIWNFKSMPDEYKPTKLDTYLYIDGLKTDKILTLNKENAWQGKFEGLDRYDKAGDGINYSVDEEVVPGFNKAVAKDLPGQPEGYLFINIENDLTPPVEEYNKLDIQVNKFWELKKIKEEDKPKQVEVYLYIDGVKTDKKLILNQANNWQDKFLDLDKYDSNNQLIKYGVDEEIVAGFDKKSFAMGDVYIFTNVERPILPPVIIDPDKPKPPEEKTGGGGGGSRRDKPKKESIDYEVSKKLNVDDHFAYIKGYKDGTVKPESDITREEVAMVFYRLLDEKYKKEIQTDKSNFKDVDGKKWSSRAISTLANGKIIDGYKDGKFHGEKPITRAEVAAIASRFSNLDEKDNIFKDVKNHWAEKYITSANEKGWVKGYTDETFKPNNNITRAEFVTLVNGVLGRHVEKDGLISGIREFSDLKEDKWYYLDMVEAINSHDYHFENGKSKWIKLLENIME